MRGPLSPPNGLWGAAIHLGRGAPSTWGGGAGGGGGGGGGGRVGGLEVDELGLGGWGDLGVGAEAGG